jgi:protein TonB
MRLALRNLRHEQWIGICFVLILHAAALYTLWSYRIIPTPDEAITLMVNLINPPPPEQPKAKPPKPPPKPVPKPIEPPKPQQLVAETPVVLPDEPVAPPPPPEPVIEAPPLPPQPVELSAELSVSCPVRSPPEYPRVSRRMNEQGKVILRVALNEEGRVEHVTIRTSSGYSRLDAAAVAAVKTWRCAPAIQNGIAVPAVALQPFVFILEGN